MEQLLRDLNIQPTEEVLSAALGDSFAVWCLFNEKLPDFAISIEWRYYNDGKAWLAKATSGKKTVFWGSAWDGFFKISLHFTEKTRIGVQELDISEDLKNALANEHPRGRLISLVIDIYNESQLLDIFKLIDYKKRAK